MRYEGNLDCPLCRLCFKHEIVTKLYYEDDRVIVVDCSTHRVPMIVLKRHTPQPTQEELQYMYSVAERLWPGMKWRFPGSIKDHFHLHSV